MNILHPVALLSEGGLTAIIVVSVVVFILLLIVIGNVRVIRQTEKAYR